MSIKNLRLFQNWAKRQLYSTYLHEGDNLVEIGCGSGGDLSKIQARKPKSVLNIDCDIDAIKEGYRRMIERSDSKEDTQIKDNGESDGDKKMKKYRWYIGDLSDTKTYENLILQKILYTRRSINVFSSQLSIMYFWKNKETFINLLDWISTFLINGGYFFGTFADAEQIIKLCNGGSDCISMIAGPNIINETKTSVINNENKASVINDETKTSVVNETKTNIINDENKTNVINEVKANIINDENKASVINKTYTSSICKISIELPSVTPSSSNSTSTHTSSSSITPSILPLDLKSESKPLTPDGNFFGHKCRFSLVNSSIENSTVEYLVYWPLFIEYAKQFGLRLVHSNLFEEEYKKYNNPNLSREEMKVSFLYRSFVFQKVAL